MVGSPRKLENHGIGMLPNGTLNIVKESDPPFQPEIVDVLGRTLKREQDTDPDLTSARKM